MHNTLIQKWVRTGRHVSRKVYLPVGDLDPLKYKTSWACTTLSPKRYLDRFSRFCTTYPSATAQHGKILATFVAIGEAVY